MSSYSILFFILRHISIQLMYLVNMTGALITNGHFCMGPMGNHSTKTRLTYVKDEVYGPSFESSNLKYITNHMQVGRSKVIQVFRLNETVKKTFVIHKTQIGNPSTLGLLGRLQVQDSMKSDRRYWKASHCPHTDKAKGPAPPRQKPTKLQDNYQLRHSNFKAPCLRRITLS